MNSQVQLSLMSIGKYLDEAIHRHIFLILEYLLSHNHEVHVSIDAAVNIGVENLLNYFRKSQHLKTFVPSNDKVEKFFEQLEKDFFSKRYVMTAERLTWKSYCDLIKGTKTLFTDRNESALTRIIENHQTNINLTDVKQLYNVWNSFIDIIMNEFITFNSSVFVKVSSNPNFPLQMHIMTLHCKHFGLLADYIKASFIENPTYLNIDKENTAAYNEPGELFTYLNLSRNNSTSQLSIASSSKTDHTVVLNGKVTIEAIKILQKLVKKTDKLNFKNLIGSRYSRRKIALRI